MKLLPPDLTAILVEQALAAPENREGTTVRVTTSDEAIARAVGPEVCRSLYPDRRFGDVLFTEQDDTGFWLVTVEDLGIITFTNRSGIPAPGR